MTIPVLAVCSIGPGDLTLARGSLPVLLEQCEAAGVELQLVLGCNRGSYEDSMVDLLVRELGLPTEVLRAARRLQPRFGAEVTAIGGTRPGLHAIGSGSRAYVVDQPDTTEGRGKLRCLGDVYGGLLAPAIRDGWQPPDLLFAFDADTHLRAAARGDPDPMSLLIDRLRADPGLAAVGARNRFAVYAPDREGDPRILRPREAEPTPPMHRALDRLHGRVVGYHWLPGGATLGRTHLLLPAFLWVAAQFPDTPIEDVAVTHALRSSGYRTAVEPRVLALNRCGTVQESAEQQLGRWVRGQRELAEVVGLRGIAEVADARPRHVFAAGCRLSMRGAARIRGPRTARQWLRETAELLELLPRYVQLHRANAPRDPRGSSGGGVW